MSSEQPPRFVSTFDLNTKPLFATPVHAAVTTLLGIATLAVFYFAFVRPDLGAWLLLPSGLAIVWTNILQFRNYRRLGVRWPFGTQPRANAR
ncbi:hypothetical protein [Demequina sp.]|uniref:hypothetical protein n=1 Tax=Demequina sp. TaxID=2050685 RepID=UPI003D0DE4E4